LKLDRFTEALAVAQETRKMRMYLAPFPWLSARTFLPQIMEYIVNTRLGEYHASLRMSEEIRPAPSLSSYLEKHGKLMESVGSLVAGESREQAAALRDVDRWLDRYRQQLAAIIPAIPAHEAELQAADIEPLVLVARCRLDERAMAACLKELRDGIEDDQALETPFDPDGIILSLIVSALCQDLLDSLVQYCETRNNQAYNRAELNVEHSAAIQAVNVSINLMRQVLKQVPLGQRLPYQERLAQYYDTRAWLNYRSGNLTEAKQDLVEQALPLSGGAAVIDYHLARIHLLEVERVWQNLTLDQRRAVPKASAARINRSLRAAFQHWRNAQELDKSKRLYLDLRLLRRRIDQYRANWDKIQSASFAQHVESKP
jgi:hypothetical protein